MGGWRQRVTWALCLAVMGFALYMIPSSRGP
jgi:hypothetical protein